ncbi:MAG: DUF4097 family beta strand repeat-containing protein [Microbacterium sp.]
MNATKAGIGAVTAVTAVVGGFALLGAGSHAVTVSLGQLAGSAETAYAGASGITDIDVDVSAVDLSIEFYDGDRVVLESNAGGDAPLRMRVDENELKVTSTNRIFDWFGPDWLRKDVRATLKLPESLRGVDADLTLQAGALRADGEFGELDATVNAGRLTLSGSATSLDAEVNAGQADITMADVRTSELTVAAGRLIAELTSVPSEVSVDVSAGELRLTLPNDTYDLRSRRSAGTLNSDLSESRTSQNRVDVQVSAGTVTLRAAR